MNCCKLLVVPLLAVTGIVLGGLCSCSLVNLQPLSMSLSYRDSMLCLSATEPPDQEDCLLALSLKDLASGHSIEVKADWPSPGEGCFKPVSPLKTGRRYQASLVGTIRSSDHASAVTVHQKLEFSQGGLGAMQILGCDPPTTALCAVDCPLTISFDQPVDPMCLEPFTSVDAAVAWELEQGDNSCQVRLRPRGQWPHQRLIQWRIDRDAPSRDGVVLDREWTGWFQTSADREAPVLGEVQAVRLDTDRDTIQILGPAATMLQNDDALAIPCSEPLAPETCRLLRFSPPVPGLWHQRPDYLVFVPAQAWDARGSWQLTAPAKLGDRAGNTLGKEQRWTIRLSSPPATLLRARMDCAGSSLVLPPQGSESMDLTIPGPGTTAVVSATLEFSHPLSVNEQIRISNALRLLRPAPPGPAPALIAALWPSATTLVLSWTGLDFGGNDAWNRVWYRLELGNGWNFDNGASLPAASSWLLRLEARP